MSLCGGGDSPVLCEKSFNFMGSEEILRKSIKMFTCIIRTQDQFCFFQGVRVPNACNFIHTIKHDFMLIIFHVASKKFRFLKGSFDVSVVNHDAALNRSSQLVQSVIWHILAQFSVTSISLLSESFGVSTSPNILRTSHSSLGAFQ